MKENKSLAIRFLWFLSIILLLFIIYMMLKQSGVMSLILDIQAFRSYVNELGHWGILLIIALMAFAILFKLLPSAAIALVSGAVYGHTWGTAYIIIGAWIGAIIAFSITRILGKDALYHLSGRRINIPPEQSQSWLMWGLFVSRLIPIIPYDLVSYVMGITPIKLWRFSIATLMGVIPTSFFLAHIGGELMVSDIQDILSGMLTIGLFLIIPVAIVFLIIYRFSSFKNRISKFPFFK